MSLGCLRDKRAISPLDGLLKVERDENVQANAAAALTKIGGPEAIKFLKIAVNDESRFVSGIAREALGNDPLQ